MPVMRARMPSIPSCLRLPSIRWSTLRIVGNDTIVGGRCTDVWAKGRQIFFAMKFSKPFESVDLYSEGKPDSSDGRRR